MTQDLALPEGARIDEDGVWVQVARAPLAGSRRPALFLDRDGVIVEDTIDLGRPEHVRLLPGAAEVIAAANRRAVPVVVVTNQSGVGRRVFGWRDFIAVQDRIRDKLAREAAFVDAVVACPHHPAAGAPYRHADHPARKPNPGMLLRAADLMMLDLARSWIVGDRARDIAAGRNAGIEGALYAASGAGPHPDEREAALALAEPGRFRVIAAPSIGSALTLVPLLAET
jgi:D-glycero-D-manno-heptose 1,7-bisphosphate phosphatase